MKVKLIKQKNYSSKSALDKPQRKPKTASFLPSVAAKRFEVRMSTDRESHDPPLKTLFFPFSGPDGFIIGED